MCCGLVFVSFTCIYLIFAFIQPVIFSSYVPMCTQRTRNGDRGLLLSSWCMSPANTMWKVLWLVKLAFLSSTLLTFGTDNFFLGMDIFLLCNYEEVFNWSFILFFNMLLLSFIGRFSQSFILFSSLFHLYFYPNTRKLYPDL